MDSTTSHPQIDLRLIEKALALTGKTIDDVKEVMLPLPLPLEDYGDWWDLPQVFSYPKFFYYLSSKEFLNKAYWESGIGQHYTSMQIIHRDISIACCEYQSGQSKPLEDLLSKI